MAPPKRPPKPPPKRPPKQGSKADLYAKAKRIQKKMPQCKPLSKLNKNQLYIYVSKHM